MIYTSTRLDVCDNSGVRVVKCIKILQKQHKNYGTIGDILIVVIKTAKTTSKIKKKAIYKSILVRCKQNLHRPEGYSVAFSNNAVVLLNMKLMPIGTRIFGTVSAELRKTKYTKLVTLCPKIL